MGKQPYLRFDFINYVYEFMRFKAKRDCKDIWKQGELKGTSTFFDELCKLMPDVAIDYPFDDAQDRFAIDYTLLRGHRFRLLVC